MRSASNLTFGSSHLNDLKSLTEDVLYETYRTEKLSRSADSNIRDSQILPSEMATQSVRIKEEQLRREEEKVRCIVLVIESPSMLNYEPF